MQSVVALLLAALALAVAGCPASRASDAGQPPAKVTAPDFEIRHEVLAGELGAETWERVIPDPHVRELRGVGSERRREGPWAWRVTVWVMEFVRDDPLEAELRRRIAAALAAVPGVTKIAEEDREIWMLQGTPSGEALVRAVAPIVDDCAPRARALIDRDLREGR